MSAGNREVGIMKFTDIISPFLAWSRAAKKVDTIPYPRQKNPGADRYRGFHINDTDKCIGCGRCEAICENLAIDMVKTAQENSEKGDSGLRPRVDYGRCCWCALCIDVCSTGSLKMSNRYSWVTEKAGTCVYTPGVEKKGWDSDEKGFRQDNDALGWAGSPREQMKITAPEERVKTFNEVVKGYTVSQAMEEAARCIQCGLCITACPAHMHIPDYLKAIAEGRFHDAVKLFYDNNPLPEMCGKVCTRQCETVCAMGYQGESIAIRWLKRFACEQFDSLADVLNSDAEPGKPNGKKVAVVGAGPSGLTAAYYLARKGYETHVFDRMKQGGGVAWKAIPEYRLPEADLKKQMEVFEKAGVQIHYGEEVSKELLNKLSEEYQAVYIAVGLQKPSDARIEGEDVPGVRPAFDFLMKSPEKTKENIGEKVLVIGGGNVAMDTARTCRRLGAEVIISYRRRLQDMPADEEEIHEAIEENIDMRTQTIPARIERSDKGLKYYYVEAKMVPNPKGGRPMPKPRDGIEHCIQVDTIFSAIGQTADTDFLPEEIENGMEFKWGRIIVNSDQYTGSKNIFAGGDITPGEGDAITAIADGLRAVKGIDSRLS